jgi:hypothetical protein
MAGVAMLLLILLRVFILLAFPVHRRNFVRQIRIAFVNNRLQGLAENEG